MSEGQKSPSPEELAKIQEAQEAADPTTYSQLSPRESLRQVGAYYKRERDKKEKTIVEAEGSRFYSLDKGESQQVIARMLKGIINVSDVVAVRSPGMLNKLLSRKTFYSREMPMERIEGETSTREHIADLWILFWVFGDPDHFGRNVREKDGRTVYFDFESLSLFQGSSKQDSDVFAFTRGLLNLADKEQLGIMHDKLNRLEDRFRGIEGERMLRVIIKDSGGGY